jgi:hypothetical protein
MGKKQASTADGSVSDWLRSEARGIQEKKEWG